MADASSRQYSLASNTAGGIKSLLLLFNLRQGALLHTTSNHSQGICAGSCHDAQTMSSPSDPSNLRPIYANFPAQAVKGQTGVHRHQRCSGMARRRDESGDRQQLRCASCYGPARTIALRPPRSHSLTGEITPPCRRGPVDTACSWAQRDLQSLTLPNLHAPPLQSAAG